MEGLAETRGWHDQASRKVTVAAKERVDCKGSNQGVGGPPGKIGCRSRYKLRGLNWDNGSGDGGGEGRLGTGHSGVKSAGLDIGFNLGGWGEAVKEKEYTGGQVV